MLTFIAEKAAEDAPALVRPSGETMTYATLAMAAAAIGQAIGARVGDFAHRIVGVAVDEGAGFVASLLAVLEGGGVALPLDGRRGIAALEYEAARARALAVVVGVAEEDRLDVVAVDASRRELPAEACLLVEAGGRRAVHSRAALGIGVDACVRTLALDATSRVAIDGPLVETTALLTALATLRAGGALLVGRATGGNVALPDVLDTPEALRLAVDGRALDGVAMERDGDVVAVRSPTTMLGYLDDAEATRAAFFERDGERWVRAHAAGFVDVAALERVIAATPGVQQAALLRAGDRLYAFVAGDATAVPRHPARVVTLDSLPHRSDGSVDREALRRMVATD